MAAPGRGLTVGQLNIDEAIVWPQQGRLLEAWATRLREAREEFAEDPPMRSLVESAAGDYLTALADAQLWAGEEWRHHFQPAWAAAIAAHDRFRGRRAAMRNSREYRVWPVSACEAGMLYAVGPDESTGDPIDLSDTHSRLGRMAITRRVALSDETVPAVVLAETPAQVADALTAALSVPVEHDEPQAAATDDAGAGVGDVSADDAAAADDVETSAEPQSPAAAPPAHDDEELHPAEESAPPRRRSSPGGGTKAAPAAVHAGSPAAVLHTDGLWLSDGTRVDLAEPITHVGHVAELSYRHTIGYQLTARFAEPGQVRITDAACRAVRIDVEAISRRDRAKSLRSSPKASTSSPWPSQGMEPGRCRRGSQRAPAGHLDLGLPRRQAGSDGRADSRHGHRA